jgi:hypothetical protein
MSVSSHLIAPQAAIPAHVSEATHKAARLLPPGIGLGIGLVVSLGLWTAIAYGVVRLIG